MVSWRKIDEQEKYKKYLQDEEQEASMQKDINELNLMLGKEDNEILTDLMNEPVSIL